MRKLQKLLRFFLCVLVFFTALFLVHTHHQTRKDKIELHALQSTIKDLQEDQQLLLAQKRDYTNTNTLTKRVKDRLNMRVTNVQNTYYLTSTDGQNQTAQNPIDRIKPTDSNMQ
jgi:cell division protein FtsL